MWRIPLIVAIDVTLAVGGAYVLWTNGGTTVTNGPPAGFLTLIVGGAALLASRQYLAVPAGWFGHRPRRSLLVWVSGIDATIVAAASVVWIVNGSYFLGWVVTFSGVLLLLANSLGLLVDVVTPQPHTERPRRRASRGAAALLARFAAIVVGCAALVVTGSVHAWSPLILNPLFVVDFLAIVVGAAIPPVITWVRKGNAQTTGVAVHAQQERAHRSRS